MRHLTTIIAGAAVAAALAAGASAQTYGPGGAVIVAVTPPPNADFVGGGASPNQVRAAPVVPGRVRPGTVLVPPARNTFDVATPPPGYRKAFDDARVNPLRGPRTRLGDAQMDGVWTRSSPQRLRPVIQVRR